MTFEDSIRSGPGALSRASATCCMLSARKCAGLKSSRREARGIALTGFVDVDRVNSRTQICNRHRHLDAAFGCCEPRLAGILTFPVLDAGCRRLALLFCTRRRAAGTASEIR